MCLWWILGVVCVIVIRSNRSEAFFESSSIVSIALAVQDVKPHRSKSVTNMTLRRGEFKEDRGPDQVR